MEIMHSSLPIPTFYIITYIFILIKGIIRIIKKSR